MDRDHRSAGGCGFFIGNVVEEDLGIEDRPTTMSSSSHQYGDYMRRENRQLSGDVPPGQEQPITQRR